MAIEKDDIDFGSIQMGDVDSNDYPDFCDAYIESACLKTGRELTEDELIEYAENYPEVVADECFQYLTGNY